MRKLVLAAVLVLVAGGAQAVTLDVIGGQLMGASNVLVDGSFYDVQFLDGTCIERYNGCDDVSDFTFQTQASAVLASQALLDQVFLDGVEGQFDSDPGLTRGCGGYRCRTHTPFIVVGWGSTFIAAEALNDFFEYIDVVALPPSYLANTDFANSQSLNSPLVSDHHPGAIHRPPPRPRSNRPCGEGSWAQSLLSGRRTWIYRC